VIDALGRATVVLVTGETRCVHATRMAHRAGETLPYADDGRWNHRPRPSVGYWRRGGGPRGNRDGTALGAVVEAFDIRPTAKDKVQSFGATFVGVALEEAVATPEGCAREVSEAVRPGELEVLMAHILRADVVIATAQMPGKRGERLILGGHAAIC
jgi:hypothetical protein